LKHKYDEDKDALRALRKNLDQEKRKGKEFLSAIYDLHSTEEEFRLAKKHDEILLNVSDLEVQVSAIKDEIALLETQATKQPDVRSH
jgi:uncharacterized small protein (DUF1192 family)